jgi:hypothetical protein
LGLLIYLIDFCHGAFATEAVNGGRDANCQSKQSNRGQTEELSAWH